MDDHDQLFKELLREFLPEFFDAFFPEWAARFDFAGTEWLDQEAFLDPPHGEKRVLDAVAKVPTRPAGWGDPPPGPHALIHFEVESGDRAAELRPRMFEYYVHLRRKYGLPVLPVAVFLRVGLGGLGRDHYEDRLAGWPVVRFEYLYLGLPRMDGQQYRADGTQAFLLALSSLMRLPAEGRAARKLESIRRITQLEPNAYRRELLLTCVERYWPLTDEERAEYEQLLAAETNQEVRTMVLLFRLQGMRELLETQLTKKFGPLTPATRDRVRNLPADRVQQIAEGIFEAGSLQDLGLDEPPPPPAPANGTAAP